MKSPQHPPPRLSPVHLPRLPSLRTQMSSVADSVTKQGALAEQYTHVASTSTQAVPACSNICCQPGHYMSTYRHTDRNGRSCSDLHAGCRDAGVHALGTSRQGTYGQAPPFAYAPSCFCSLSCRILKTGMVECTDNRTKASCIQLLLTRYARPQARQSHWHLHCCSAKTKSEEAILAQLYHSSSPQVFLGWCYDGCLPAMARPGGPSLAAP